jgi:3'-phosphoadenosine 5'-phosphosulfate sulfotransferase (PAPS reductase)/FAD synthetase
MQRPEPEARPARSAEELAEVEQATTTAAVTLIATNAHVALSYSGGAESGLLLHLFRPLREWLTLVWTNPGSLPHEAEHVRAQAADWPRFVEIPSDREAAWRQQGIPTWLLPLDREPAVQGDGPRPEKPMTAFHACCYAVRTMPFITWAQANAVTLIVHGQRRGEGTRMFAPGILPAHWGPLAGWTREEVMARVAHHGIALPRQYAEGFPESFECAVCPADLRPDRLGFLRRHYPAEHAETLRVAREAYEPGLRMARSFEKALARAEADAEPVPEANLITGEIAGPAAA